MTRCIGLQDAMLNELVKLKDLKHLNLYALPYLKCEFLKEISNKEDCKLEFLDLCGNLQVVDEQFIQAAKSLGNLKYLNLVYIYINYIDMVWKYYR